MEEVRPLLVSCTYCGSLHNRGEVCKNRPKDNRNREDISGVRRFRSSGLWRKKREAIKKRDKYLCQFCLDSGEYTFQGLEVHHIRKLSEYWRGRLDDHNLITLCRTCHDMADSGNIEAKTLLKMAKNADAQKRP
jgi:5-methylcytosine-specific restriction enzyme A